MNKYFTWEQIHNITAPFCVRGDRSYPAQAFTYIYLRGFERMAVFEDKHMSNWAKIIPTEIYLN